MERGDHVGCSESISGRGFSGGQAVHTGGDQMSPITSLIAIPIMVRLVEALLNIGA